MPPDEVVFCYILCSKEGGRVSDKIKRLIACGFTEKNAEDICFKYGARGDWDGLENFIRGCELLYDDRKEYPKEEF